jgi:hypothetical protein
MQYQVLNNWLSNQDSNHSMHFICIAYNTAKNEREIASRTKSGEFPARNIRGASRLLFAPGLLGAVEALFPKLVKRFSGFFQNRGLASFSLVAVQDHVDVERIEFDARGSIGRFSRRRSGSRPSPGKGQARRPRGW